MRAGTARAPKLRIVGAPDVDLATGDERAIEVAVDALMRPIPSCSLDVADQGGVDTDDVAVIMDVTPHEVRRIARAFRRRLIAEVAR